jgi:hypothetical protein
LPEEIVVESVGRNGKAQVPPRSTPITLSLDQRAMEQAMTISMKGLLAVIAVSLPMVALAQSNDAGYCRALVAKYEAFLDQSQKRGEAPQDVAAKVAVEKCKAGDASGIPDIEKALKDAKLDLPPRT